MEKYYSHYQTETHKRMSGKFGVPRRLGRVPRHFDTECQEVEALWALSDSP